MPFVNQNKCTNCGACVKVCPVEAISIKEGKAVVDQEKCIHCGKCLNVCPQDAIRSNFEDPNLRSHGRGRGLGIGPRDGRGRGLGRR